LDNTKTGITFVELIFKTNNMEKDFENFYRISKYADLLGVDKETVRLWVKSKKVKSIIISGTTFVIKEK
jgi:hypothetical protein